MLDLALNTLLLLNTLLVQGQTVLLGSGWGLIYPEVAGILNLAGATGAKEMD